MTSDRLSMTLAALADPTRRAMLARLGQGEATVMELAAPFQLKLPTVSKHLKVLKRAGLISQGRRAQWRPCHLETDPLRDVAEWIGAYSQFWTEQQGRLEQYLQQLQMKEGDSDQHEDDDDQD
ncbi:MAG: metalloregulator ArsR/SmtB family transcription factor [Candidatus Dormiibacterota bacterium]